MLSRREFLATTTAAATLAATPSSALAQTPRKGGTRGYDYGGRLVSAWLDR